jgi:hypothetical protein
MKIVLPKNKGSPRLKWDNKCPFYRVTTLSGGERTRFLLENYGRSVRFIYRKFYLAGRYNLDGFLQESYDVLMLYHGLLDCCGSLYLDADQEAKDYLLVLVEEIFGVGDMRIHFVT